jgi:spermidine dehydrogenase
VFFSREAFGIDRLVTGDPMRMVDDDIPPDRMNERPIGAFLAEAPVSDASRAQLLELFTSDRDPFPGESDRAVRYLLERTSYRAFLKRHWGLGDEAADTFQGRPHDSFAMGIDAISAIDAMETGYPGFAGVGLHAGRESAAEMDDPYTFHFPDGNATIARLLVRSLIPAVTESSRVEDVVTARFDYSALDVPTCPVRLRLRSTAVSVRNANGGVVVGYARNGTLHCVHAKACVLAGYAMMVPAIMPELAESQAAALASNVKAPIAYLNVAVRDWHPWVRLGVHEITNPMGFFSRLKLDIRSRSAPTDAHAARTNRSCSISCTCRRSGARTFPSGSGSAAVAICFTTSSSPTSRSAFATSSRGCCLEADSMPTATSPRSP